MSECLFQELRDDHPRPLEGLFYWGEVAAVPDRNNQSLNWLLI